MSKYIYFGTPDYALETLKELIDGGFVPELVVCSPDKPSGRKQTIVPGPVKVFAQENNLKVFQPEKIDISAIEYILSFEPQYAVVAAYNKILPQKLISAFEYGILNVHPSLLPLYRGPAPDINPILNQEKETGISIILIDELVDHGPILYQEKFILKGDEFAKDLGKTLFARGGNLLREIIPKWLNHDIKPIEQEHSLATMTKKITKTDGLIELHEDPKELWAKWRAYYPWPGLYFFEEKNGLRVKITEAHFSNGLFVIDKVIPENGKEIKYSDFVNQ